MSKTKHPPRVWIRTEPYHDDALKNGEVVSTDIANHYARRGSHWIEHVHIAEHQHHMDRHAARISELEKQVAELNIELAKTPDLIICAHALAKRASQSRISELEKALAEAEIRAAEKDSKIIQLDHANGCAWELVERMKKEQADVQINLALAIETIETCIRDMQKNMGPAWTMGAAKENLAKIRGEANL